MRKQCLDEMPSFAGECDQGNLLDVDTLFIAKGCERRSHVLDWLRRIDRAVYASAGDICIGSVQGNPKVQLTKRTHLHAVTYLRVFRWNAKIDLEPVDFMISGDENGLVVIHSVLMQGESVKMHCIKEFSTGSNKACCCCSGYIQRKVNDQFMSVFAYSLFDHPIHVFYASITDKDCAISKTFEMSTAPAYPLCIEIFEVSESIFFAAGKTDSTIQLFSVDEELKALDDFMSLRGHSNWVTDLAVKSGTGANGYEGIQKQVLLASAGQDNVICLWRCMSAISHSPDQDPEQPFVSLVSAKYMLVVKLEAILSGHEDWVVSVDWHPNSLQLLSASADKSLIIWEQSTDNSRLWLEKVRVGEVGGQASGYNGGCYSGDGLMILAVSYFGGFYAWHCEQQGSDLWEPHATFTGHSMGVCDLDWDPSGTYLLSCSLDQTTRCFVPTHKGGYSEVARPQVHGHDFTCIASVSSSCYISGSEEKILRVFRAPLLFAKSLSAVSGIPIAQVFPDLSVLAEGGAVMPALGLSNKQMEDDSILPFSDSTKENLDIFVAPTVLTEVPTEDRLMQSTLWPEQQKLYGHGFEIFSVAANHSGTQVASSSKASQLEHAIILIWDTSSWKSRVSLTAHRLTVTQMEFSNNDRMLASVSRDRTFSIFIRSAEDPWDWRLMYRSNEKDDLHSRIIWSCSWSADNKYLATCSRDKKLVIWQVDMDNSSVLHHVSRTFNASLTAVSFCPCWKNNGYLLAIGQEDGIIEIYWVKDKELQCLKTLDYSEGHSATVKRLRFRPKSRDWAATQGEESNIYELASASSDNGVKVHRLKFKM